MKILVDVNLFIDVITKRANWDRSLQVLNLARKADEIEGWISALTFPLIYFFRLRVVDEPQARTDTQAAVKGFQIIPLTQEIIDKAVASSLPDFEDNIQLISAETVGVDHLLTRNKRDFVSASLPILTPEEWLAQDSVIQIQVSLS